MKRYGVPANALFIPFLHHPWARWVPSSVCVNMPNRKALFDIGISGPLAGLVPTLCCIIRLHQSTVVTGHNALGEPLLFKLLVHWFLARYLRPRPSTGSLAMPAGWASLSRLNLIPIRQLDGATCSYALLRKKAYFVTTAALMLAIAAVLYTRTINGR